MTRASWVVALCLAACGGSSNATYYKLALGQASAVTGTDCGSTPQLVTTVTGIDGDGTIAIYAQPNNQYLLDLGAGSGLTGTLASNTYTFTGTTTTSITGSPEITTVSKNTFSLTPSGPGITGTYTVETSCNSSSGTDCTSADGNNNDCTQTIALTGSQVSVTQLSDFGASPVGAQN